MTDHTNPQAIAQERFTQAAFRDDLNTVRSLLDSGLLKTIPKAAGAKALFLAEGKSDAHTVKLLLAGGVHPDDTTQPLHRALYMAVTHSHHEIIELLLEAGADPNGEPGRAPLLSALFGKERALEMLLAAGARTDVVTEHGTNALHRAAEFGQPGIVRRLLQEGVPVDSTDPHGNTAMHHAASGSLGCEVLPALLEHGANIEARSKDGATPALRAAFRGSVKAFEALVAAGANPLATSPHGNAFTTALNSVYSESGGMALHVLQHYPSLAPIGDELDRAFAEAVRRGHTSVVEKLADLGADLGQKPGGRTLLQIAGRDATEMKRLLRSLKTSHTISSAMRFPGASTSARPARVVPVL